MSFNDFRTKHSNGTRIGDDSLVANYKVYEAA